MKHLWSRTFIGTVVAAIGHVLRETRPEPNAQTAGLVLETVGAAVAGYGVRAAIDKNGKGR